MLNQEVIKKIDPPVGITKDVFRTLVLAAHLVWQSRGIKPTAKLINEISTALPPKKLEKLIQSDEFAAAMNYAGIPWLDTDGLSDKQILAIMEVSNPLSGRTVFQALKAIDVSHREWIEWRKNPVFESYYTDVCKDRFTKLQPEMDTALIQGAMAGKLNYIQYVNEITGRFDNNQQQVQNLELLVQKLLEVLQEEVKDPEILGRIATRMQLLNAVHTAAVPPMKAAIKELYS